MNKTTKIILYIGLIFIFIGLGKAVSDAILLQETDIAFFVSTGIALVVASWLQIKHETVSEQDQDIRDSIISKNMGYIILGLFILIGLVLLAAPFIAILIAAIPEMDVDEDYISDVINTFKFPSGTSYYAFLLGVLYFLSSKNNFPK